MNVNNNNQQITIPNPLSFVINKLLQLQNLKYAAIAMINILATKEGQELFKSLLKGIEPSMKLFIDEMLIQVEKNKPKIVELVKELGQPVSQAIRDSIGIIPGVGEGLALYLALKNTVLASLNGANLVSTVVDNFIINPAMKILKETDKTMKHISELKHEADSVKKDFNNILQLFDKIDKETSKIEKMANNGSSLETLLITHPKTTTAPTTTAAPTAPAPTAAPTTTTTPTTPTTPTTTTTTTTTAPTKGGMRRRQNIIRNSTKRIKKWVKRFTRNI
jgi:hypothetical protein